MRRLISKIKNNNNSSRNEATREPSPKPPETVTNAHPSSSDIQESTEGDEPTIYIHPTINEPNELPAMDLDLPNSSETYEEISEWLEQGLSVARNISEAKSALSPLKSACIIVIRGLQLAKKVRDNKNSWEYLLRDAEMHANQIQHDITKLEGQSTIEPILTAMTEYSYNIKLILQEAKDAMTEARAGTQGVSTRFARTSIDTDTIELLSARENVSFVRYQSALEGAIAAKVTNISTLIEDIQEGIGQVDPFTIALGKWVEDGTLKVALQYAYGADLDQCEPGTRVELLAKIRQWSDNSSLEPIFWLRDAAGTGKSTIAVTMADEWLRHRRLAGRFFFSPNIMLNKSIKYFCRTVAADIACQIPELRKRIGDLLMETPSMESKMDFALQLSHVILQPLSQRKANDTVILVVDALDNCNFDDQEYFLKTILSELPKMPHLKLLLTSRLMPNIAHILNNSPFVCGQGVQLLDINNPPQEDIAIYVHSKLRAYPIEDRQRVIDHSRGLFVWAATFCRTLLQTRLGNRLLENLTHETITGSLDVLYLNVLKQALSVDKDVKKDLKRVLQIVISAFQPISTNAIITFLPQVDQVNDFVQDLAGIIKDGHPDRPLKVLHPTFREFIASNEERANGFVIQLNPSHSLIGGACLDVLRQLSFDMLGVSKQIKFIPHNKDIDHIDHLIESRTSAAIRYASSYWAHHITASEEAWTDWLQVSNFLRDYLCYWLEFMSWRGMVGFCHQALGQLNMKIRRDKITGTVAKNDVLTVQHAFQFLFRHQDIIKTAAFHTYTVPVAMIPKNSPLCDLSKPISDLSAVKVITSDKNSWENHMLLAGQDDWILRLKVSPDGSRAVTIGRWGSVCLWDLDSGEKVGVTLPKYSSLGFVTIEADFSPDGRFVAIGHSGVLYLWDARTGRQIWKVVLSPAARKGNSSNGVRFSPTQPYVAYATEHFFPPGRPAVSETRLYDVTTGHQIDGMLSIQPPSTKFKISPDGMCSIYLGRLETSYNRGVITVVNMETFQQIKQFDADHRAVSSIGYSADSSRAVVSWRDHSLDSSEPVPPLLIIDCKSGDMVDLVDTDDPPSCQALCMRDGIRMISLSTVESKITLWDMRNGRKLSTIRGLDDYLRLAWISPDGKQVAALSNQQRIGVWDIETGESRPTILTGYTGTVAAAQLSSLWNKLLVQASDSEMRVFDLSAEEAALTHPERDPQGYPHLLLLSNSSSFVIWSHSHTLFEVWDVVDGQLRQRDLGLTITPAKVVSVAETPDGSGILFTQPGHCVVSISLNPERGTMVGLGDEDPKVYGGYIYFTPSGSHVVISGHEAVQVWNYRTGESLWKSMVGFHSAVAISADGTRVAGTKSDTTYLYNLTENQETQKRGHYCAQMVFNPAGDMLAYATQDSMGIWDVRDSILRHTTKVSLPHESDGSHTLSFSPDGKFLVLGSSVWELHGTQVTRYVDSAIPKSLRDYDRSFLTYRDGWIHSAFPPGPILPVPPLLKESLSPIYPDIEARRNVVVLVNKRCEPFWIDCSAFVTSSSETK